ncbi:MAG: hypothetical protein HYX67_00030 [Candidatus Melainabacteria bacterium]|nr:hypothetical protein [Candidatus Melainabacteria bacterium]
MEQSDRLMDGTPFLEPAWKRGIARGAMGRRPGLTPKTMRDGMSLSGQILA